MRDLANDSSIHIYVILTTLSLDLFLTHDFPTYGADPSLEAEAGNQLLHGGMIIAHANQFGAHFLLRRIVGIFAQERVDS